jgi:hypothetical protein
MKSLVSKPQIAQLRRMAISVALDAAEERLEDFVARELGWTNADRVKFFPTPDPNGYADIIAGYFTSLREDILRDDSTLPSFVVYNKPAGGYQIVGLIPYLQRKIKDARLVSRLRQFALVRKSLLKMRKGHYLEAVAAALLDAQCDYSQATRGSGDQGVDAIAWTNLFDMEKCFLDGACRLNEPLPGEKVFVLVSAKANLGWVKGQPKVINPAHIRDIIGGWVIQRSTVGVWQNQGILMLSPTQMLICTSYRLSEQSKLECRRIGVQVWGLPELIYLVCKYAPDNVFDAANNYLFDPNQFKQWWKPHHVTRLQPA